MSRTKIVAILAGLGIAGLVAASAATLGGLNTDNLGADVKVVAACDTSEGIDVSFVTEYSQEAAEYVVTDVTLDGVDAACKDQTLGLTLADGSDASIGTGVQINSTGSMVLTEAVLSAQPFDVEITATTATANAVRNVAVVITGPIAP